MVEAGGFPQIDPENPYYSAVMALFRHKQTEGSLAPEKPMSELDEQTRFGLALKLARKAKKLTTIQLHLKCGIDPSYISKIETGTRPPPKRDVVLKLADALEFDDRADRLYFILFSGRASIDDFQGIDLKGAIKQTPETE